MDLNVGSQVLLGNRPAVVVGVTEFTACAIITVFRPSRRVPPLDLGIARVGDLQTKCVTFLRTLDGQYFTEVNQRAGLPPNHDPATFIALDKWLEAFAGRCRA